MIIDYRLQHHSIIHNQTLGIYRQNTLGAFSDFSFLTTSPCCETRSYRPEGEEEEEEEEEVVVAGEGAEEEEMGGAIPGL